jgi:hypothetical protein
VPVPRAAAAPTNPPHQFLSLRQFGRLNTRASRTSIPQQDFAYQENLMVVGPGNLQTVRPAAQLNSISNPATATPSSLLWKRKWYANINSVDWEIGLALDNATVWAMRLDGTTTYQLTGITGAISDVTQYDDQEALLIGPAGFFSWDGTSAAVVNIGTQQVYRILLTNISTATVQIDPATISPAGHTFTVNEQVTLSNGQTATLVDINTSGTPVAGYFLALDNIDLKPLVGGTTITGGTSGTSATIIDSSSFTDGHPAFAAGMNIFQGTVTGKAISFNSVTGELIVKQTSAGSFTLGGGTIYSDSLGAGIPISVVPVGAPSSGDFIAVYASRVWISSGRAVTFSGPGGFTAENWDVALGSGSFNIEDPILNGNITRLWVANGYLYIFGSSCIFNVSNVFVPSGQVPPTPLFSLTNIDAINGTPFSYSIAQMGRYTIFYNVHGVHALLGFKVERISTVIDTTMQQIDTNPPGLVSAAVGICNNLLTFCLLLSWFDPTESTTISRQVIFCFHMDNGDGGGPKWFVHDPGLFTATGATTDIISVLSQAYIAGDPVASAALAVSSPAAGGLANASTTLYGLFRGTGALHRKLQTALWDFGSSIRVKRTIRLGFEVDIADLSGYALTATVDGVNALGAPNASNVVNVTAGAAPGLVLPYSDMAQTGLYLGVTISGVCDDTVIQGINLEYQVLQQLWEV